MSERIPDLDQGRSSCVVVYARSDWAKPSKYAGLTVARALQNPAAPGAGPTPSGLGTTMANNTKQAPSKLPSGNTSNGAVASASPAQVAQAKALASAPQAPAVAQPSAPQAPAVGLRTLPGNVLAALVASGAKVAHCAANPKRPNSKAAAAWPTLAKCGTVAVAVATPGMAPHMAYALAHGQAQATLPSGATLGNTSGQPLTLAQLAAARAALGIA